MEFGRLRACLDEDCRLLTAALEAADPAVRVPSCPDWDAAALGFHVAEVYGYVAEAIRTGHGPEQEPPRQAAAPARAVELGYAALIAQLDAHAPADFAPTWYEPDRTVGFWIRRMAHETAVHRIDAELAARASNGASAVNPAPVYPAPINPAPVNPVPDDLAADGIDEFLTAFVGYRSTAGREQEAVARLLEAPDRRPVVVREDGGRAWRLTATPDGIAVAALGETAVNGSGTDDAVLTVSGPAPELLAWLWNRAADPDGVQLTGDPLALAQFNAFRAVVTA